MPDLSSILQTLALGAFLLWAGRHLSTALFPSAVSKLPGPGRLHFWSGNLKSVLNNEPGQATLDWHTRFGKAIRFTGFSGQERLSLVRVSQRGAGRACPGPVIPDPFTSPALRQMDPAALHHVLRQNSYAYENAASRLLVDVLGPGLICAEGDVHKRQRKLVNPAFSPAQIGKLEKTFESVARDVRLQKSLYFRSSLRLIAAPFAADRPGPRPSCRGSGVRRQNSVGRAQHRALVYASRIGHSWPRCLCTRFWHPPGQGGRALAGS